MPAIGSSKTMTTQEAVSRFVHDGASLSQTGEGRPLRPQNWKRCIRLYEKVTFEAGLLVTREVKRG
jgi:hypothetical protein